MNEINKKAFYRAWHYLENHRMFEELKGCPVFTKALVIEVVMVNPETEEIDDDKSKNTKVAVWLECGPYKEWTEKGIGKMKGFTHDIHLDCGADTFEEAITELAKLVRKHYPKK